MNTAPFFPWAENLFLIAGALALAIWCIYWDLRRRLPSPRIPAAHPSMSSRAQGKRAWRLEAGIGLLAAAWLLRYLSQGWGRWLEAAGYGAFIAGAVLVASHVALRLSSPAGETKEG